MSASLHLIIRRLLQLDHPSVHMNLSTLHVGLNAVCWSEHRHTHTHDPHKPSAQHWLEFPLTYQSSLPGRGSSQPSPWRSGSHPECRPGGGGQGQLVNRWATCEGVSVPAPAGSYLQLFDVSLSLLDDLQVLLCDGRLLSLGLSPLIFPAHTHISSIINFLY